MKLVIFKRKITIFFSDDIFHQFSLLTTQSEIYYQVNYLFLVKNMIIFLLLVKLKCHSNFHCVLFHHVKNATICSYEPSGNNIGRHSNPNHHTTCRVIKSPGFNSAIMKSISSTSLGPKFHSLLMGTETSFTLPPPPLDDSSSISNSNPFLWKMSRLSSSVISAAALNSKR